MNKHTLVRHIVTTVYAKEKARVHDLFCNVVYAHGSAHFWYRGMLYGKSASASPLKEVLVPYMDEYIKQRNDLLIETKIVNSYLASAANLCTELGQLYEILPESLHAVLSSAGVYPSVLNMAVKPDLRANEKGKQLLLVRLLLNSTEN